MNALVIGAGPAGIATVGWLHRYEAPYDWVDAHGHLGGMLRTVHNPIVDLPGIRGEDGVAVSRVLADWVAETMDGPDTGFVERIAVRSPGGFQVSIDGEERSYDCVVVATGTRRRILGVPGEAAGLGDYVLLSTTRDPERFAGHTVAIVGGADAAIEGALNLAEAGASEVIVLARSRLKAQRHFVQAFRKNPAVVRYEGDVEVTAIEPLDDGCRVRLDDGNQLEVHALFVRIGVEPVVPELPQRVALTPGGFILVDARCQTNLQGLFAVGDVVDTPLRSVSTCLGDGARAGRSVAEALGVWR